MGKLLILSSDTGEGHNSAATALEATAAAAGLRSQSESRSRNPEGSIAPSEPFTTRFSRVAHNAWETTSGSWTTAALMNAISSTPMPGSTSGRFLDSEKPDIVLSVHPMLNHFIQRFIKEERLGVPCNTFLTDPFPPFWQGWASPWVDRFFVPTHEALQELTAMGVQAWRIEQVPMPVRTQFRPFTNAARDAFHEEMNLDNATTILINGGARGGGPLLPIYHAVRKASPGANILVVCGRNESLRHRLQSANHPKTQTFGFVEDIHRFIAGSDLVLTKPGALSTYETLACGVPVLLLGLRGLMPQESGLFHAAAHYEFGFVASRLSDVEDIINQGRQTWNRLRSSLAAFYQISYGEEIVERILHAHAPA